jgi:hypothetical protein
MAKIEPALQARLQQRPGDAVRLIVRVAGDTSQAAARVKDFEVTVHRSFTLIPAFALTCLAETALSLLQEPWVQAIEQDRRVSTQAQDAHNSAS